MKRDRLEVAIQNEIEAAVGSDWDVLLLRNSVGKAEYVNKETGATYYVSHGLGIGSPDIVIFLAPLGRAVGLEVKVPGQDAEPHQAKCHAIWRRFGVHVEVVHSVDEARAALNRARKRTSS